MKRYTFGLITVESELTDISVNNSGKIYQSTTETQYSPSSTSQIIPSIGVDGKPFSTSLEYLVVGGGGGGGSSQTGNHESGGGGAGGLKQGTFSDGTPVAGLTLLITVGAGGISQPEKSDGDNSSIRTIGDRIKIEVKGGGFGGATNGGGPGPGNPGGSGGGGGSGGVSAPLWTTGGVGIAGQGNPGGINSGGGGGASTAGLNGTPHPTTDGPGYGGFGIYSSISGANVGYGGGGAGRTGVTNTGASHGGGLWPGGSANINTGGGGGAGGAGTPTVPGGNGGSGIVVIRYPNTFANATLTSGSPNVIYANSNVIYRFWQSGTIAW